jgi:hypothetical protein
MIAASADIAARNRTNARTCAALFRVKSITCVRGAQ